MQELFSLFCFYLKMHYIYTQMMKKLLLFLLLIPALAKAQTPITPSWSRQTTQVGILDTIGMSYSGQITKQYFGSTAWVRRYMINNADTNTFSATRYWVEHVTHNFYSGVTYYNGLNVMGTGGNSISIDGNSFTNPATGAGMSFNSSPKIVTAGVIQFADLSHNFLQFYPDGTIKNLNNGKNVLYEGDAPTVSSTYTKTQVDSAANTRALKTTTITGGNGNTGGGDLSANRVISNESYATSYGLVPDSLTDNTSALATMKAALGTNKILYFNATSAGHVYRFNSAVTFAGYTIKSDPGVIISQSSITGTNLVGAHIITPTSFRARDAVQVSVMQQNTNLPDFYPSLSGIDKTEQPSGLAAILPSSLTKSGYNSTSDSKITGVGTATSLQYAQTSGLIAASAAPDSLTFDLVETVTPRPGKEYTMSAGFQAGVSGYTTGGSAVSLVNFGNEWVVLRVSGSKYYLGVKKSTLAYTETSITKFISGAYLMGSGRNTLMSARLTGSSTVEFYVNGLLITRYTSTGQVQSVGFGVNRALNQSAATISYGMASWDLQRKQSQGVLKIAYFGDSIIAGELRDMSISTQVKTGLVGQNGISNVIGTNYGVPSTKLADVATLMATVDLTQYNYVVVQSGINDVVSQTSASSISTSLNTIATLCASAGTRLIIGVVPNAIDSASTHMGFAVNNYDKGGYARAILATRAASNNVIVADVNAEMGEISATNVQLPDNLHPSSFFANIMAKAYARAILNDSQPITPIEGNGKVVNGKYIAYGTAIPTNGYHIVGDLVYNSTPTANGIFAWVCTTAGIPGTYTPIYATSALPGTVSSVSVTTANGVSGSVATPTTTPAITLTLGAITPTSIGSATTVITQAANDNSNKIASTAYVNSAVNAINKSVVRSSASTLTLVYGTDYIFTGTTTTYTLPAVSASNSTRADIITIKNAGSGNITLNSNTGSTIYDGSLVANIMIAPGASVYLVQDGTQFNKE